MSEAIAYYRDLKSHKKRLRAKFGVECPVCKAERPKTNASILTPGQICRVDKYKDIRPELCYEEYTSV